ncbi:MAG: hypothetical protein K1X67_05365 [Fimbriimonadaceae bacterium]|nr:hypothetical protein [Fimbriimonadaceae bacterium]
MSQVRTKAGVALLLVTCGGFMGFAFVFLRGCAQKHTRPVGHGNVTFDVSQDGSKVVFAAPGRGGRDLYLLDIASNEIQALTSSPEYELMPALSPDGQRVAFTRGKDGVRADQLCLMDLSSRSIKQLTDADENITSPTFTQDGKSIVFALESHYRWGGLASSWNECGALAIMDLRTGERRVLMEEKRRASDPMISNDGKWLAWSESQGICIAPMSLPLNYRVVLPAGSSPAFNSDGKMLAFLTGTYSPDVHVELAPISGTKASIVPNTYGAKQVQFLPNGRMLVLLESWRSGGFGVPTRGLWETAIDGTNRREVISEARMAAPFGNGR